MRQLASRSSRAALTALALGAIVLVGAAFRFAGADWDEGRHLHPDERYLSIVADNIELPGAREYFDVDGSRLSPFNTPVGTSFVYGTLPLFATKLIAASLGRDDYGRLNIVGRRLSALIDTLSIGLVFLLARLLMGRQPARVRSGLALLAAALYALTVGAIQHAHFFTSESWLVFFTLLTTYLAALVARGRRRTRFLAGAALVAATGIGLGLAVACKASAAVLLLPVAIAFTGGLGPWTRAAAPRAALRYAGRLGIAAVCAYVAFRLVSPYAFASSSWLALSPNEDFRAALEEQRRAINGEYLYPPAYQWLLSEPLADPLGDMLLWQLGPALGGLALAGFLWLLADTARRAVSVVRRRPGSSSLRADALVALMILAFVLVVFFNTASRFVHTIRYLVPLLPFMCLAAAYALGEVRRAGRTLFAAAVAAVLVPTLLWAAAFGRVYREPNTRVAATDWLNEHARPGATILNEHWDDALPVGSVPGRHVLAELPVYDPDDGDKLDKLHDGLSAADYYVLSSPRAWHVLGRLHDRFPLTARFYEVLFEGRLGFREEARFTSYPGLFGVSIHDLGAEETFWVYDHPPVLIFRKVRTLPEPAFRALFAGLPPPPE